MTDKEFRKACAYPILHHYLKSADCEIYDEAGKSLLSFEPPSMVSYVVVENNVHSVQKAVSRCFVESQRLKEVDWFDELRVEAFEPVIKPHRSSAVGVFSRLRDRKTGVIRKLIKLGDDPKAFLLDSKFRMLRMLGRAFYNNTAGV